MNLGSVRCVVMALSISVAVGFIVKACSTPELIETFGEKSEWSTLQAIELQNRNAALNAPVIRSMHDREVLGVRGVSGENIWILLRTESPPFYKQMPMGQYDIPASLVDQLEKERRLSYTVTVVLRSHIPEK
jgi:hypothetical protein